MDQALLDYLFEFIVEDRKARFEDVVTHRTRHISVVLEDIFQPQNASAVLRSCDCFGVQDVHIIENKYEYNINPDVALGSGQWLSTHKYNDQHNNTVDCIKQLQSNGYQVLATSPRAGGLEIHEVPLEQKTAIMFGTEQHGLSEIALKHADQHVKIPMFGFTESFNISVSAAICLYSLTTRLRESKIKWQLTSEEKIHVLTEWARSSIKKVEHIEERYAQMKIR